MDKKITEYYTGCLPFNRDLYTCKLRHEQTHGHYNAKITQLL